MSLALALQRMRPSESTGTFYARWSAFVQLRDEYGSVFLVRELRSFLSMGADFSTQPRCGSVREVRDDQTLMQLYKSSFFVAAVACSA